MPASTPVPAEGSHLYGSYLTWLSSRGIANKAFLSGARSFFVHFPDPQGFAALRLEERCRRSTEQIQPLINYLMLHGHLRPGYDYLLARRFHALVRDATSSPIGRDLDRFQSAAESLGYSDSTGRGMTSQVAMRLLIQSSKGCDQLDDGDFFAFEKAISEREQRCGRSLPHYRRALHASRTVIYHLGAPAEPALKRSTLEPWSWERHLEGVQPNILRPMAAYLKLLEATHARTSVQGTASELAHFGRFLARVDPELASLQDLDRRRHIEPYLSEVPRAISRRTGAPIVASTQKSRILSLGAFFDAMAEWGWDEAPARRLIFSRDVPKLPRPLPRYLPPDDDRALVEALEASQNRLFADALLLLRQTGLRIGELCDLELDCIHEVPGQGAWLKVPLGKLTTERMVPIDEETVTLVDRIVVNRSPGRPLLHPGTGALVEFLLTHQGRRVSAPTLREELRRAAKKAGLDDAVPHQLRHTYATALVNAGCSLQALMALLGHVSAEMSLRYGRLFDQTVRENYERALAQAKASLGPVMPEPVPVHLESDWRKAPLIKARLAGGYCLRTPVQGPCAYANICEHCPNFRSEANFLPVLQLQRVDAEALLADAEGRGWGDEARRHRRLIERIDALIAKANAS